MTVFCEAGGSIANQPGRGQADPWHPSDWPSVGQRPDWAGKYRQGMHMPKWASRITLNVTDVRVQRLQDISEQDALAEGVARLDPTEKDEAENRHWCEEYGINGDRPGAAWRYNPWVAAISFKPILMNINASRATAGAAIGG